MGQPLRDPLWRSQWLGVRGESLVLDDSVRIPLNHHKGPCFLIGLDQNREFPMEKETAQGIPLMRPRSLVEHDGRLTSSGQAEPPDRLQRQDPRGSLWPLVWRRAFKWRNYSKPVTATASCTCSCGGEQDYAIRLNRHGKHRDGCG